MFEFSLKEIPFLPHTSTRIEMKLSPGTAQALTGENGIGKSTLLKRFYDISVLKERIVFGQQKSSELFFDRHLESYRKILESHSEFLDKDFFQELWKESGLQGKEKRLLSHMSGGESQLLKLISLSSSEADIYFFDEPGQSLDQEKKIFVNKIFSMLLRKKKTLLIVEHDCSWLPQGTIVRELGIHNHELQEMKSWTI